MGTRGKRERQEDLWVVTSEVVGTPAHAFYDRLNEILDQHHFGWHVSHGDVTTAVELLRRLPNLPTERLASMGELAQRVLRATLSQEMLCARFCDALEEKLHLRPAPLQ